MPTRRRPRGTKIIGALIATVMVAFGIGALALTVATDEEGSGPTTTTLPPLSGDAAELLELLDLRDEATYHAKYDATAPGVSAITLETWQVPPLARQDSEVRSEQQVLRTRALVRPEGQIRCVQVDPAPWTCRPGADAASPADPLAGFRERLRDGTVEARDATVDGRAVRCFRLTTPEGTSELCALPDNGIPVRVSAADSELRLVALDTDPVPAEHFEPPAEPTPA